MTMTTETAPAGAEITYAEPEAGVYPGTFTACEPFQYDDKTTGETELRWRWVFWSDEDVEFDTLTSRSFRPGTNALKLFTGILGRAPVSGDKPSDSYGKHGSIVYSPNKGGKLTVTEFHADRAKGTAAAKPAAVVDQPMTTLPNMTEPTPDELPF
jgi:hypothetical protein